jgi:uncharacterized protein CbrC (UPF0167 family)
MILPPFRYHPDPLRSGSIVASENTCRCCGQNRGYIYTVSVYAEEDLSEAICPWCIADGSAHRKFGATFVDAMAFGKNVPRRAVAEITQRTPGFGSWQPEQWPACCKDATAFLLPAGIAEIREQCRELEGDIMSHIVYGMQISGGAATRLLNSLQRDSGPTLYVFRCLNCKRHHFHVDFL